MIKIDFIVGLITRKHWRY